ncbi:hemolysin family protein [Halobium salinum]|uniref:Hemolysin family protein n=1 Tax=Halobium salinum TaxID=1364940 RepID=A0ABD5P634_9EURY
MISAAGLLFALFLVFLNGFFVASEFALVRIRPARVSALVESGRRSAKLVQTEVRNLDDYLAVCQLGITLSSLGLGWVGEPAVAALIDPVLGAVLPESLVHLVALVLGFGFITFLHVVFGELAPKTVAIQEAERIALLVAAPMRFFYILFKPGIVVFNGTANYFTRLAGISPASESEESHTEEEIRLILARSQEEGHVDVDEVEMIEGVFELGDTAVREIMIPRPDVVTLAADASLAEVRSLAAHESYTRYPVLDREGNGGERVVGFVHVKDLFRLAELGAADAEGLTAADVAREVLVVPESYRVDGLLSDFRKREAPIAVVIDEWGAFEGMVTIEDTLEEIVGDIRDEFDREETEPGVERVGDGVYLVDGSLDLGTVNERVGSAFESAEFETVGGLVLSHLGRPPEVGDAFDLDGYRLRVDAVDGARVETVTVSEAGSEPHEAETGAGPEPE